MWKTLKMTSSKTDAVEDDRSTLIDELAAW
jgi:hypothetical protein